MPRCARAAGSDSGFTLLEVLLATVILATAATTVILIYVHSVKQAAASRDLNSAVSVAKNALEEGLAKAARPKASGDLPDRPTLKITYEEVPAGKDLVADTLDAKVTPQDSAEPVIDLTTRRAVYIQPPEEGEGSDAVE
jgi:prepilin-type N-terminal cleavage/methylation domain-containing protein